MFAYTGFALYDPTAATLPVSQAAAAEQFTALTQASLHAVRMDRCTCMHMSICLASKIAYTDNWFQLKL